MSDQALQTNHLEPELLQKLGDLEMIDALKKRE